MHVIRFKFNDMFPMLLTSVLTIFLPLTAVLSMPLTTYPIYWDTVASEPGKNLTANCICNLVAFSCDPGCCCDPFCPETVVNATIAAGACLPEGPPDQTLDYCVPDSIVRRVRTEQGFAWPNYI